MAATMLAKLSSVRTTSAASRATSVPVSPIATPMSARFSAGASLTAPLLVAFHQPRFVLRENAGEQQLPFL